MKKNTYIISGLTSIIIFSLTSCAPVPFTRHKSPTISGTLISNNEPAKGIHLYLSIIGDDQSCAKYLSKTITNDRGQFSISSIKEKMDYTPLMTHYLDEWTLCIDRSGARQAIYSNNRYGKGRAIASVNLECDLDKINQQGSACRKPLLK